MTTLRNTVVAAWLWLATPSGQRATEAAIDLLAPPGSPSVSFSPAAHLRPHEREAGAAFAKQLGASLFGLPDGKGTADYLVMSGKYAGKTLDLMLTAPSLRNVTGKNWKNVFVKVVDHLKDHDLVGLDYRNLTRAQQGEVDDFLKTLSESDLERVLIVR